MATHLPFRDRREAGALLGGMLRERGLPPGAVVLALPRGGVPVGLEVARSIDGVLDIFAVRKVGLPQQPELAAGAIASGGVVVLNEEVAGLASAEALAAVVRKERAELERREREYREGRAPEGLEGRTVIVVDDGLATGASMRAAVEALRAAHAERITVAVPVGPADTCDELADLADEVVCAATPQPFGAVGLWYEDFAAVSDDEVRRLVAEARAAAEGAKRG